MRGGERVLDYGSGSGVLAIAAAKLGAAEVTGVDIEKDALEAARSNATRNGVSARFSLPEELPTQPCDRVVANILTNTLEELAPRLAALTASGGLIALSGILEEQATALASVYAPLFAMRVFAAQEGWVCLEGLRNARCVG